MKIQEVCNKTGLTKRNIHFYIKEKLLTPKMNEENGYYNFDDEDCRRLLIVRELRKAGLPIPTIRSVLNAPAVTGYYLRLHVNQLKKEIWHQQQIVDSMEYILESLPVNPNLENVLELSEAARLPEPLASEKAGVYETGDHNLINQFVWMGFLPEEEFTEYQQYLWNKLNRITSDPDNLNYRKIKLFLATLSREQIDTLLTYRHQHERQIAAFDEEGRIGYIETMKKTLEDSLGNDGWIEAWKKNYEDYYYPVSDIYDSYIQELIAEISPWFSSYLYNIHTICGRFYNWLHTEEGKPLLTKLTCKLEGYLNLEHCHHCELEALCSVRFIEQ